MIDGTVITVIQPTNLTDIFLFRISVHVIKYSLFPMISQTVKMHSTWLPDAVFSLKGN